MSCACGKCHCYMCGNQISEDTRFNDLLDCLENIVNQHCKDGTQLDSMSIPANTVAMILLEKHERLDIINKFGTRIIGKLQNGGIK